MCFLKMQSKCFNQNVCTNKTAILQYLALFILKWRASIHKTYCYRKLILIFFRNGYHFETAMLLSIFLGMFGADRFYLGYPAIGLLKFCTMGFMFLGQLVDIILIATQVVGPADGSYYIIPYYGAKIEMVRSDNWTYRVPQDNW